MKMFFAIVAEFALFLLLDVIGGVFYHPFHIETMLSGARSFAWDGILFMLLAWSLLLLVGAARKRFAASAVPLSIALVLATATGYVLKVGFATHQW
ncbi:glucan phosphoethanolaminetransferase (alkaline phosphatase superfamily) [Granulicella aggregans]|uniref:Glucan phosphoethanolaminetransferase (Alkaline phosphatase superfamily) n=1 Tax=Granulicella aggregans TaxID=474949 RepID=A0A7W7ZBR0_9BACT|nr:hypothetical protein [Granulicella aggregans]MBB5056441.1 glucan phosphoethanolaminetransferase (alkaline phosphatase superfamily) [Granulicella aggregans]